MDEHELITNERVLLNRIMRASEATAKLLESIDARLARFEALSPPGGTGPTGPEKSPRASSREPRRPAIAG